MPTIPAFGFNVANGQFDASAFALVSALKGARLLIVCRSVGFRRCQVG
jgi:hypothetical protein